MSTQEHELTTTLERFLRRYYKEDIAELASRYPNEQTHLEIDWMDLFQYDAEVAEDVLAHPREYIDYIEEALANYDLPVDVTLSDANVRIVNIGDEQQFNVGEYRARHREQLLSVAGQITKTTKVRPQLVTAVFECDRCGNLIDIPQHGDDIIEPYECAACERQGPFTVNKEQSTYRDYQLARLQEPPEETKGGDGRFIDVNLYEDQVDTVQPGDRVDVVGSLEFAETKKRTFDLYLRSYGIEIQDTDFEEIDVDAYREEIDRIAASDDPVGMVADSIAPKHRGDERIKEAVALQLFGGKRVHYPDGMVDRGNIHILLLGDPGTGKSTILNAVSNIAPRSVKSSGKGSSASGMTAAAVRDDFGDTEWTLEAGAMVLANKGIACVDEIDKVDDNVISSLHGALEDEVVHINKAGINASLPAQTSLLAAGNPKYGRFDEMESKAEQIDLDAALMSRFDLMFMVSDNISEEQEQAVARHMIRSRRNPEAVEPAIDEEALRAYIAHAKQTVNPRIEEDDVEERLSEFFSSLRLSNQGDQQQAVPVTRRKLEAIQRLAEASARGRLSEEVTRDDVERAIGLVMHSMRQVGYDSESGRFDADIVETGTSMSQKQRMKTVMSLISELETVSEPAHMDDLEEEAEDEGIPPGKLRHAIQSLKEQGEVYEPGEGTVRTA